MTTLTPAALPSLLFAVSLGALPASPAPPSDGCGTHASAAIPAASESGPTIVEAALQSEDLATLVAAVKAAGLVETLSGKGPFTVFAPTDAAFEALPKGALKALLQPQNREQLTALLTYHVVPDRLMAEKVVARSGAVTVNGQRIDFSVEKKGRDTIVRVDGARVVTTDIACSNGVVHVIDAVIMPAGDSLVETAARAGTFQTLLTAAKAAGLAETLAEGGPFTIFAPTDEAFAALPEGTVATLLESANKDQLVRILKHHVVPGRVYSDDLVRVGRWKTLAGTTLTTTATDGGRMIGGGRLSATDLDASNGVIHVVDAVLLP